MAAHSKYLGVDGCKDGWFCVILGENDDWSYRVVPDAYTLGEIIGDASSVLIDIPIGLLDEGPDERTCDKAARKLLGAKRGSSVFPAPARQSLTASNYQEALEVNRQSTGRGLSQQAWAIVPKIREIDRLLILQPELQGVIRECHPELCFWALNAKSSMQYNKKKEEGKQERLAVLERFFPQCHELYEQASSEFLRKQVAHDDIIDAMVCAVTAKYGYGHYTTAPEAPVRDSADLAMEMVYWVPEQEVINTSEFRRDEEQGNQPFDTSSKQYRQLEEVLSWRFITELYRRYPKQFKLIEAHPGNGQYDCLTLLDFKNGWNFAIDVNRDGGSVHVHDFEPGIHIEMWQEWVKEMLSDDPKTFIDQVCRHANLRLPEEIPTSTPEIITLRFISEFLTHSTGRLEYWEARNGYLDSSGYDGCSVRQDWFDLFPEANNRLKERVENDVLGVPAYRFWFLLKNDKPQLCLETTGKVYRLDGKVLDIASGYKKYHRIWPLIVSAAIDLLP